MPIPGFLHGLEIGYAHEVAAARQQHREREDQEFSKQLSLLDLIRQNPNFDERLYNQVLTDTIKLHKGQTTKRTPAGGMGGFLGKTETEPYASDLLKKISTGEMPIFNDPSDKEKARQPIGPETMKALQEGPPQPQGAPPAGGYVAGSAPPSPTPPEATGPSGMGPGGSPAAPTDPGAGGPPIAQAGPSQAVAPPVPQPPPGPIPQPPGSAEMLKAGVGLTSQVASGGPLQPGPPPPAVSQPPAAGREPGSSVFKTSAQSAQSAADIRGIGSRQDLLNQAKAEYDALISVGMDPDRAKLAVARKLTGFTGGITTSQGSTLYKGPDSRLVKPLLQHDQYGQFTEIDPLTKQPIDASYTPFIPGVHRIVTDAKGVDRVVDMAAGSVGEPLAGGKAISKPQIQPPGGPIVITTGSQGEPSVGRMSRTGTTITPATVAPPPAAGAAPSTSGQPTGTPAVKYEPRKPYSQSAISVIVPAQMVRNTAQEALNAIDQLIARGHNPNSPVPQEIMKKFYSWGWVPGAEDGTLEAHLLQMLGANEANALKTVMGGRPNMKLIDILQQHTAQGGEALNLSREKLQGLISLSNMMEAAVNSAEGMYRPRPYEQGGRGVPPAPGGRGASPVGPKGDPGGLFPAGRGPGQ